MKRRFTPSLSTRSRKPWPDKNEEGGIYTYTDTINKLTYIFIWGSGTIGGGDGGDPGGTAGGDPYITTLSGITYKMDDFTGFSRMLQGTIDNKLFTINAENQITHKGGDNRAYYYATRPR